jgi:hypothetical protein
MGVAADAESNREDRIEVAVAQAEFHLAANL